MSISKDVRKDKKEWVLSKEEEKLSAKFDVRDLGCHLDTTFRGWSSAFTARVRLVISRLVLIFAPCIFRLVGFLCCFGVNGASPWAASASESASHLVEAARGRYSSGVVW